MPGRTTIAGSALALAAAALLALPPAATAQDPGPAYTDWNPEKPGYPSDAPRSKRAECVFGSDRCIDRTIGEMYRRFHRVFPVCDHNAVFSLTYLRVTEDIRTGLDEGFYSDPVWLNQLDALFARPYFLAYDNYLAGRTELIPPAWRIAFDAGRDRTVEGLGNLLLSMNAHVNRDFPFVLYQAGLVDANGQSRKAEHDAGNERLRALYRPMLTELAQRFDETIDDYDVPGVFADDEAFFDLLVAWREGAWQNAQRLAAAGSDAERRQVAESIESYALAQAEMIYAGTAYGPGESSAARDAQCAVAGGQSLDYDRGADFAKFASRKATIKQSAALMGNAKIKLPVRCPNGPGPCAGLASSDASTDAVYFFVPAGKKKKLKLPARPGVLPGVRTRIKLRSVLAPGEGFIKRRTLRIEGR